MSEHLSLLFVPNLYELQMVIATCQLHDLLNLVIIILLSKKRNKMLNIKTTFYSFQIVGKEEFSKRTNTLSWEGSDHAKILTKPISTLYNVCSVHRGMFSTSGRAQYIGGIP